MDKEKIIQLTNKIYRITLFFPKKEPLRYKMREIADDILENLIVQKVFHSFNPDHSGTEKAEQETIFAIKKDLEILSSYFEIAKYQNWVSYFDILEIEQEYDRIKKEISEKKQSLEEIKEKTITLLPDTEKEIDKPDVIVLGQAHQNFAKQNLGGQARQNFAKQNLGGQAQSEQKIQNSLPDRPLDMRKEKILEILKEKGRLQVGELSKTFPEVSKRTLRRDFVQLIEQGLIERIGKRNDTFYQIKE